MAEMKTKPINEWLNELPNMNLSTSTNTVGVGDGQTGKLNALLFYRVLWNTPDTLLSELTNLYNLVSPGGRYILIELYGYSSALLLFYSSDNYVRGTNFYTGKKFEAQNIDPNTLTITKLLSDYVVEDESGESPSGKSSFVYKVESNAVTMSELINSIKAEGYIDGTTMGLAFTGIRLGKYVGHILTFGGNMFTFCLFDYMNLTLYVRSGGYITETIYDAFENAETSGIPSLEGYAKTSDIPSLEGYAKTSDIPSLDGYAKTTDLFSKDYNDLKNQPSIPSIAGLASTSYVDTKVAGIVNSAPAALDTLNELSKALGNDANFSATVATQIGNKVDKVDGKGLSTNDYTTAEKNKLAGIAEGANKYTHPDTHPASMITGLSKVATSGSYNDLTDKPNIPSGGSSSGGGASIIDITEEPSNPDTNAIYRIQEVSGGTCYMASIDMSAVCNIIVANGLPEVGEPAVLGDMQYAYYNTQDGQVSAYVSQEVIEQGIGEMLGITEPCWVLAESVWGAMWGGVVNSATECTEEKLYVVVSKTPSLYFYYNNGTELVKSKIITSDNFKFDASTGTLVLDI